MILATFLLFWPGVEQIPATVVAVHGLNLRTRSTTLNLELRTTETMSAYFRVGYGIVGTAVIQLGAIGLCRLNLPTRSTTLTANPDW